MPQRPINQLLLRCYRAGVLVLLVGLVYQQARWFEAQRNPAISVRMAHKFFPAANRVQLRDPERGLHYVTNLRGETIGCLLTTAPHTDNIIGYSGPNNVLIALDRSGIVIGVELLHSGDTVEHVQKVRYDPGFFRKFISWKPDESPPPKVDAVTGATLTSSAIAEAIQQRLAGASPSLRFPEPVTLDEVRTVFTNAVQIIPEPSRFRALDAAGKLIGYVVRTSPQADNVSGYRGPTECLVALAPDARTVTSVRIRKTYDTDSYVNQLRRGDGFLKYFADKSIDELVAMEPPSKQKVDAISGATMTAQAITESLKRRAAAEVKAQRPTPPWRPKARDWALASVIAGALILSFSPLRGHRGVRIAWQLLLVGYVGLVNHDMLSLALFGGWAANGIPLKAAPGLVLLATAALLVPWTTRRQIYCHQICPHGAAQQLVGGLKAWLTQRFLHPAPMASSAGLSARWTHVLEHLPGFLLCIPLLVLLLGWPLNLVNLEPFDAWAFRTAGIITVVLAVVGLAASVFIPQAYCRFGCPTGAVLGFVRSSGSADRWGRKDSFALGFVVLGIVAFAGARTAPKVEAVPEPMLFTGHTWGTNWSVKIRDEVAVPSVINKAVGEEFEWAESLTTHGRTNTDLYAFNHLDSLESMAMPSPVMTLSQWAAEISRASGGAYDITSGPLMRLWGIGAGPSRSAPPNDSDVADALKAVGWQKLVLLDRELRKQQPNLEVDLSSLARGWAVDQVAVLLDLRSHTNYLIEAGSELRARGPWTVSFEHPGRYTTIVNESLATSTYRPNWNSNGRQIPQLIDPRTGRPVSHSTVTVSVRHTDAAHAAAWARALNILGVEAGLPLAERLGLAAEFVSDRGGEKFDLQRSSAWRAAERKIERNTSPK